MRHILAATAVLGVFSYSKVVYLYRSHQNLYTLFIYLFILRVICVGGITHWDKHTKSFVNSKYIIHNRGNMKDRFA